tara:strand:- start:417 stop:647 length:231 start_codon:yes stop_codon:yes gene_type:complete
MLEKLPEDTQKSIEEFIKKYSVNPDQEQRSKIQDAIKNFNERSELLKDDFNIIELKLSIANICNLPEKINYEKESK